MALTAYCRADTSPGAVFLPNQIAPKAVQKIAEVGVPEIRELKTGTSLAQEIVNRCGTLNPVYVMQLLDANKPASVRRLLVDNKVADANPSRLDDRVAKADLEVADIASLRTDRLVVFPACARAPTTGVAIVGPQQNIARIASSNDIPFDPSALVQPPQKNGKPAAGPVLNNTVFEYLKTTLEVLDKKGIDDPSVMPWLRKYFAVLNAQVVRSQGLNPTALQPGTQIAVPALSAQWSSVSLKADVNSAQVIHEQDRTLKATDPGGNNLTQQQRLAKLPDEPARPGQFASLVGGVDSEDAKTIGNCQGLAGKRWDWPFDIGAMLQVLALNREQRLSHSPPLGTVPILILDTGIDPSLVGHQAIPDNYVDWVPPLAPLAGAVRGSSENLVLGVNLAEYRNDPTPATGYAERLHGIGVAGAAIGSRQFESLRRLLKPELVKIAFANIVGQQNGRSQIEATQLSQAFSFALDRMIPIINASFSLAEQYPIFEQAMKAYGDGNGLLVVAAGNDLGQERDLEAYRSWPASYGGNPQNSPGGAVITVGAHDGDGEISPFSKRGEDFVDLLAPGCKIPTYTGAVAGAKLSIVPDDPAGTSFATPLVSFVAALLEAEDTRLGAHCVKARLIVSVDEKPALKHLVWSRGILNAWKALAIYNDVVTVADKARQPTSRIGHFISPPRLLRLCGDDIDVGRLRKLTLTPGTDPNQFTVRKWLLEDQRRPDAMRRTPACRTAPGDDLDANLDLTDSASGETMQIEVRSIRDWVPPVHTF